MGTRGPRRRQRVKPFGRGAGEADSSQCRRQGGERDLAHRMVIVVAAEPDQLQGFGRQRRDRQQALDRPQARCGDPGVLGEFHHQSHLAAASKRHDDQLARLR